LTRLINMGVKPFLVSTAIQGIMAQRLVRKLCQECAEAYEPTEPEIAALGLEPETLRGVSFKRPRGCRVCEGVGYRGRLGLFELLAMDDILREMTFRGESLDKVRAQAVSSGKLHPLIGDGARKVIAGTTSVTEILRVTRSSEAD